MATVLEGGRKGEETIVMFLSNYIFCAVQLFRSTTGRKEETKKAVFPPKKQTCPKTTK
jgi:hypothetical protein